MNQDSSTDKDKMEAEYDFTGGVRGKYFARYHGVTRVLLAKASPFVASPLTESNGQACPDESTLQIVATGRPVYQGPTVVDNTTSEVSLPAGH